MSKSDRQPIAKSKNDLRREHMERQKAVKRRRRILAYCVTLFFVLVIFTVLAFTVFFRISEINISGKTFYSKEDFITASGLEVGDQLYLFSTEKAEKKIKSALPFVEEAEITRKITGKVTITVKAAASEYVMAYGEKYIHLNKEGKVLSISDKSEIKGKTLIITGAAPKDVNPGDTTLKFSDETEEKRETAKTLEAVLAVLRDSKLENITEINIKKINDIKMEYQNRITLRFGTTDKLDKKVQLAINSITSENNISYDQKGTLDLRVYGEAVFSPAEK